MITLSIDATKIEKADIKAYNDIQFAAQFDYQDDWQDDEALTIRTEPPRNYDYRKPKPCRATDRANRGWLR